MNLIKQQATDKECFNILGDLYTTLIKRKNADPKNSYVASLYNKGINKILQKIGEESYEVTLANIDLIYISKSTNKNNHNTLQNHDFSNLDNQKQVNDLINEIADLWFHCFILLAFLELDPANLEQHLLHIYQNKENKYLSNITEFNNLDELNINVLTLIKETKLMLQTKNSKESNLKQNTSYCIVINHILNIMRISITSSILDSATVFHATSKTLQQRMGISGHIEKNNRQ